mmetsp:Transcript_2609/g.5694  ORF Transcript_2609/g.5694 Transcript_2609/m.5694 type:complete len:226 (-) Transcript_2609:632-1309(-)
MVLVRAPAPMRYNPSSSFGAKTRPVAPSLSGVSLDSTALSLALACLAFSSSLLSFLDDFLPFAGPSAGVAVDGAASAPPAISQEFSTMLSRNAGLTPLSSKKTSPNAFDRPGAAPTTAPSTETRTPSEEQSNRRTVPGEAAPFAATPSRMSRLSVSTAPLSDVRGSTLSAMAAAIFSADTLKFILRRNVVVASFVDCIDELRAERAPDLSDLEKEAMLPLTSSLV